MQARARRAAPWAMAVALALIPTYVIRPHVGPLPTTLLEIVLVVAMAIGYFGYWNEVPWRNPYTWPALVLLAGATLDTLLAPDRRAAAGIWKAYFVEPMLAGLLIAQLARSRRSALMLLGGLGVAGVAIAGLNLGTSVRHLLRHDYDFVTPPVSLYNSANDVPLFLVPLCSMAAALILLDSNRRIRWAAAAFLALAAGAIGFSLSRSGWVALGVTLLFVAFFSRWRFWVLGGLAVVGLGGFFGSHRIRDRVLVEFDPHAPTNTINLRLTLWRTAWNMLTHRPLQGGGLAGFKQSVAPFRDAAYGEQLIYPHNIILNFWSETGLLGLAGFVWLFGSAAVACRRALQAGPWPRLVAIGVLGMLVDYVVHGLTDVPYFKNDLALEFWALLGLQLGAAIVGKR